MSQAPCILPRKTIGYTLGKLMLMKLVLKVESKFIALVQEGNEFHNSTVLLK